MKKKPTRKTDLEKIKEVTEYMLNMDVKAFKYKDIEVTFHEKAFKSITAPAPKRPVKSLNEQDKDELGYTKEQSDLMFHSAS